MERRLQSSQRVTSGRLLLAHDQRRALGRKVEPLGIALLLDQEIMWRAGIENGVGCARQADPHRRHAIIVGRDLDDVFGDARDRAVPESLNTFDWAPMADTLLMVPKKLSWSIVSASAPTAVLLVPAKEVSALTPQSVFLVPTPGSHSGVLSAFAGVASMVLSLIHI